MDEIEVAKILEAIPVTNVGDRGRGERVERVQRILSEFGISSSIDDRGNLDYPDGVEPPDQPLLFAVWNLVTRRY